MNLLLMLAICFVGDKPLSYEQAFSKAQKDKKPLMVVVCAKWCMPCRTMKRDTIDPMVKKGELKQVVLTYVDKDDRPKLAKQVMKGDAIPQVCIYTKTTGRWRKLSLIGMQSRKRIRELVKKACNVRNYP